jgi:hypothetical protein
MTTESPSDPDTLRKEINVILDKVTDRGSLLFCLWLVRNVDQDFRHQKN